MSSSTPSVLFGWSVSPGQCVKGAHEDTTKYSSFELAAQAYYVQKISSDIEPTAIVEKGPETFVLRIGRVMIPSIKGETTYTRIDANLPRSKECPDGDITGFERIDGFYLEGRFGDEDGETHKNTRYPDIKMAAAAAMQLDSVGGFNWDGISMYELRRGGLVLPSIRSTVAYIKTAAVRDHIDWCVNQGFKPRFVQRDGRLTVAMDDSWSPMSEEEAALVLAQALDIQRMFKPTVVDVPSASSEGA
jgi:hypothetical protein